MKKRLMLFLGISLTACEDAHSNSDLGSLSEKVESQNSEPQNTTFTTGPTFSFKVSVESDLVDVGNGGGCYTVNVRVYLTDISTGERTLLANENVKVGDGCPKKSAKVTENSCEPGYLPNGDYVMSSELGGEYRECLRDYLIENEEAYGLYLASTRELINNL